MTGIAVPSVLVGTGVVWPGRVFASGHPVRGVDVSSYQGEIDWSVLAAQDLTFAWIKATEGSSSTDPRFATNWERAPPRTCSSAPTTSSVSTVPVRPRPTT